MAHQHTGVKDAATTSGNTGVKDAATTSGNTGDRSTEKGVVGIANIGNSCYANSAIQLLRHCSEWSSFCLQGLAEKEIQEENKNKPEVKVMMGYLDILKPLWSASKPAFVQPGGFWDMMRVVVKGTIYEEFLYRIPHDAHEFLQWLMDRQFMATQKKREFHMSPPKNEHDPTETMAREAVKAWIDIFKEQYSPLTDLCFGLLRCTSVCQGCSGETRTWETFNMLKIQPGDWDKKPHDTLLEMLERELQDEMIEDFQCDKCHARCPVIRSHKIWRLPRNLFVVLKRFNPDGSKNRIPLEYHGTNMNWGELFAAESPEVSKEYKYKLFGTIDHHGGNRGGHYTAQGYNPLNNKWWMYDDESAYLLEWPKFGSSTYILGFCV